MRQLSSPNCPRAVDDARALIADVDRAAQAPASIRFKAWAVALGARNAKVRQRHRPPMRAVSTVLKADPYLGVSNVTPALRAYPAYVQPPLSAQDGGCFYDHAADDDGGARAATMLGIVMLLTMISVGFALGWAIGHIDLSSLRDAIAPTAAQARDTGWVALSEVR